MEPQRNGNTAAARQVSVAEAADTRRSRMLGADQATTAMAATVPMPPTIVASTWTTLATVRGTPGGSLGARPATTAAIP